MKITIHHQIEVPVHKLVAQYQQQRHTLILTNCNPSRMTSQKVTQKIMALEKLLRLSMQEPVIKKLDFKIS